MSIMNSKLQNYLTAGLPRFARNDEWSLCGHCEHINPALHFGVVHERNALLTRPLLYPPFAFIKGENRGVTACPL